MRSPSRVPIRSLPVPPSYVYLHSLSDINIPTCLSPTPPFIPSALPHTHTHTLSFLTLVAYTLYPTIAYPHSSLPPIHTSLPVLPSLPPFSPSPSFPFHPPQEPIKRPMVLTREKQLRKEACDLFKLVLQFMGDRRTKQKNPDMIALDITTRCWEKKGLRDEIYVQLCRQTSANGNK